MDMNQKQNLDLTQVIKVLTGIKALLTLVLSCIDIKVYYHGTTLEVAQKIAKQGFKQSKYGNLGQGVYFTDDKQVAGQIANYRAQQRRNQGTGVILKCVVSSTFKQLVDCKIHGRWNGVTNGSFKQYVVRNQKQIRVLNIQKA